MRRLIQAIFAGPVVLILPAYMLIVGRAFGFLKGEYLESLIVIGAGYALCCLPASIFLPLADLRDPPLKWVVSVGLVIGLFVVAYFFWNSDGIRLQSGYDILLLWIFLGPAVVAFWNLVLIVKPHPSTDEEKPA